MKAGYVVVDDFNPVMEILLGWCVAAAFFEESFEGWFEGSVAEFSVGRFVQGMFRDFSVSLVESNP